VPGVSLSKIVVLQMSMLALRFQTRKEAPMIVLGIETSCDETAASVVGPDGVMSDVVHTQEIHQAYGGVVPELAGRAHADKIVTTVQAALQRAGVDKPDAVVATSGPGLIGAVLVGLCFGKSAAAGWGVPFVGVNHLEGHLLSATIEPGGPAFPFLSLVVSGGHTTLYLARGLGEYEVLGETVDDAAGEAFDKVARMLGLGYPGGPKVDALAQLGSPTAVKLPRPQPKPRPPKTPAGRKGIRALDMSFSGLKTAVRGALEKDPSIRPEDMAASFQAAVIDVLTNRVRRASAQTGVTRLAIAGGVAANSGLRAAMMALDLDCTLPPKHRCTDNAAMIAHAGRLRLLAGQRDPLSLAARAQWTPGTA
jgi:N6-L-threonylcarbamoyladenine synthase